MSLFGIKEKKEIAQLKAAMTPEQKELADINVRIEEAQKEYIKIQKQVDQIVIRLRETKNELEDKKREIIETDEAVLLQSFGIYTPHYYYSTSDEYKKQLELIRDKQKVLIKNGRAATGNLNWQVNGSAAQGKKMVSDMQKLLLRAFNAECDDAVEHVRFNNIEACEKRIRSSADSISKLGKLMQITISYDFINLKLEELRLMHEYQQKKQEEKEAMKELRAQQREEARVARELEEERKKLEKEKTHYENELKRILDRINVVSDEEKTALEDKRKELEKQLQTINKEMTDVDYRQANQRAGYVYIISNIGAFGENVYKIGMTRRLDPMERIDELGSASVPFDFDVHAIIFTDDAPKLEAALHTAFANRKINHVNQRREFFRVSLDEIKEVVQKNYDKTVEFVELPPAEQYRESLKIQESINKI
jgi:hypothetical protein